MKQIRYLIEYLFLSGLGFLVRLLPRRGVIQLGARAGDFIYYCAPVRKKLMLQQLKESFPEKTDREIASIAKSAYRNLATNSIEHLCLLRMDKNELLKIVTFSDLRPLEKAISRGKGVIYVGGHFGNWEYLGSAISMLGYPISYVVADIGNPYIDKMVNSARKKTGVTVLNKGMSMRKILQTLKSNGTMAMLMDQDAGRNGIFLEFFGKSCSTVKGPALFALKTGATVLFVSTIRQSDGTIKAIFDDIVIDYAQGPTEENIREVMQQCTSKLEEYVRQHPGHWFWMHRRWKTRPVEVKDQS